MDSDISTWAATLELEAIDLRKTSLELMSNLSGTSNELKNQLNNVNVHLAKLKHLNCNTEELVQLEVEKYTSTAIEDLDIRLARCTRKLKDVHKTLNDLQTCVYDQESIFETFNNRLNILERQLSKLETQRVYNIDVDNPTTSNIRKSTSTKKGRTSNGTKSTLIRRLID